MIWLAHHVAGFLLTLAVVAVVVAAVRLAEYADRVGDRRQAARDAAVVDGIVADAQAAYRVYVQQRAGASLLDEYAAGHPMPKRPAPPAPPLGEPWQLPGSDRVARGLDDLFLRLGPPPAQIPSPGLVEPGVPNEFLNGENR